MREQSYTGTKTMEAMDVLSLTIASAGRSNRDEMRANRLTMWTTTWNLYTRT